MVKKSSHRQRVGRRGKKNRTRFQRKGVVQQTPLFQRILSFLATRQDPVSTSVIMQGLSLPGSARKVTKEVLVALLKNGKIRQKNKKFRLASNTNEKLIKATLSLTRRGFGFATIDGQGKNEKDIFISQSNLNGASHGDTVLIRILGNTSRGRKEAQVVSVSQRAVTTLCGLYVEDKKGGHLLPDDPKLPFTVSIPTSKNKNAKNGIAVRARITDYGTGAQEPIGEILEILGDPLTVKVQLAMAMEQLSLEQKFPARVQEETRELEPLMTCEGERRDLRHISHVTIDGATAKDFDDAIAVEETARGFRLYVSIADVSHYVQAGSAIDNEAYKRGTSVYFPNMVLPMLPERLSNDLCSLVPHQDRPAFSAIMDFDHKGRHIQAEYCKSMINSRQRFTYNTVDQLLYQNNTKERETYHQLLPMLTAAAKLSALLRKRREKRGSLGFNIPEAAIVVENDKVLSMSQAERNSAHLLIEDFMLAANESVAETLARAKEKVLFRIHERPDPTKVKAFTDAAGVLGLHMAKTSITPAWFADVLDKVRDKPAEYVVNNLLLRTMQRARYSPENLGHFGLAAEYYLHFTSPIRRYPDLIAHRVLQNFLVTQTGRGEQQPVLASGEGLLQAAQHLSDQERVAINAERDVQARLSCLFLIDRIGEEFDGAVSGVASFGLFVELTGYFISGAVPIGSMKDDYYHFDSTAHRLMGERSKAIYQLGHPVKVRLEHVDLAAKRITFSLVSG